MAAPPTCGHGGRTAAVLPTGRYCDWCYRNAPEFLRTCGGCTTQDHLNRDGLCKSCRATNLVQAVFTDAVLQRQPTLAVVRDHFRAADPAYLLLLKKKSNVWRLIETMVTLAEPVTHAHLDRMGSPRSVSQLRSLLVELAVLPARDEYAIAVQRWVDDEIATLTHRDDQLALRRFMQWGQPHRRGSNGLTAVKAANDRNELRVIGGMLRSLNAAGASIATADQRMLDAWARQAAMPFRARRFLAWCAHSGITRGLTLPAASSRTNFRLGGRLDACNEAALHRALTDEALPARMRLAVLLTTVYAIRIHRIAALRREHLRLEHGTPAIRLGTVDAQLPAVTTPWVVELQQPAVMKRRVGGAQHDEVWLFPGYRHGSHMLPSSLSAKLKVLGVAPVTAHQAAAGTLITQMPPAVVARLIGIDVSTAAQWQAVAAAAVEHR